MHVLQDNEGVRQPACTHYSLQALWRTARGPCQFCILFHVLLDEQSIKVPACVRCHLHALVMRSAYS